ncbi:MAG: hypothetical protein LBU70_04325 [Chitinispirillales bacterium]|jgi:hypothetical protein|nr:hypothetical protein [Chitinispirillales bacterium]
MASQKKIRLKNSVIQNLIATLDMANEVLKGNGHCIENEPEVDILDQILIVVMTGVYIGLSLMAKPFVPSVMIFMITGYCGYRVLIYVNKIKRRRRQMKRLLEEWAKGYTAGGNESKHEKERLLVGVAVKIYRTIEKKLEGEIELTEEHTDYLRNAMATLRDFLLGLKFHNIAKNKKKYIGFCSTTFIYGVLHEANNALNNKARTRKAWIMPDWQFRAILAIMTTSALILFALLLQSDIASFLGIRKDGIGYVIGYFAGTGLIMVIFFWIVPAIRDKRYLKQSENLYKQWMAGYTDASKDERKKLEEEYAKHFYKKIAVEMHRAIEMALKNETNVIKERTNYLSNTKNMLEKVIEILEENWETWEYPKSNH